MDLHLSREQEMLRKMYRDFAENEVKPLAEWLWDNDNGGGIGSGDWKTLETRQWMEELGVRVNYCIKDGDQIIN